MEQVPYRTIFSRRRYRSQGYSLDYLAAYVLSLSTLCTTTVLFKLFILAIYTSLLRATRHSNLQHSNTDTNFLVFSGSYVNMAAFSLLKGTVARDFLPL
jgi:hypothetical protein